MIKRFILYAFILSQGVQAQVGVDDAIREIISNNIQLKALQSGLEAGQRESKIGLNPENPEVEMAFLKGDPSDLGTRMDFSVTQSFDFPSAYKFRKEKAKAYSEVLQNDFDQSRRQFLLEIQLLCHELVFLNKQEKVIKRRLDFAERVANSYHLMFEKGEINVLEKNKALINLIRFKKRYSEISVDKEIAVQKLQAYNAGVSLKNTPDTYDGISLVDDFDSWFKQQQLLIPELTSLNSMVSVLDADVKLQKALCLPHLSAGYMMESVGDESFSGLTVGISVPLWENKNTVKHKKFVKLQTEQVLESRKIEYYYGLKQLHSKALAVQLSVIESQEIFKLLKGSELLDLALEKGEISILDYIQEMELYLEIVESNHQTEKEFYDLLAQLNALSL